MFNLGDVEKFRIDWQTGQARRFNYRMGGYEPFRKFNSNDFKDEHELLIWLETESRQVEQMSDWYDDDDDNWRVSYD